MSGTVDLHIHSNRSCDGDFAPAELVRMGKGCRLRAMAIADHDTVAAYPEALDAGRAEGVEVIPNIEFTTVFGRDDREFHLQVPFLDWAGRSVAELAGRVTAARFREARERVDALRALGFDIAWAEVEAASDGAAPLGVKIAQVLLDKTAGQSAPYPPALASYLSPERRDMGPYFFYRDYFAEGKPAFVPKRHVPLVEVLAAMPALGGVAVLSHPGAYFQNTTAEDLAELKERGLAGLEVYSPYHTAEQVAIYKELARTFDLVATAGSDFHGRIKPNVAFGSLREGDYRMVEELRRRGRG
ncbi:MAG: PHP domain-containing protein [Candidatus Aminicenantes bacterium]|nr:PHP domain-containing protein [Candidatus Aminicenantes bacterium]